MSQKAPSVIDYFHPNGSLYEEAGEFEGLDLAPFVDKRSKIEPDFNSPLTGVMPVSYTHLTLPTICSV